jgi:predicted ATPase
MLLEHLVDHSLVLEEPGPDPRAMRFRLLETVRLYAEERLAARGAEHAAHARQRHANAYFALAERAEVKLLGPAHAHWFARLEAEHATLRSALAWAVEDGHIALAERLAAALTNFWGSGGSAVLGALLGLVVNLIHGDLPADTEAALTRVATTASGAC